MKLTTARLKKLIKEAVLEEYGMPNYTPEQQAVADKADELAAAIEAMGEETSSDLVDYLVGVIRAMKAAGYDPAQLAMMA